MKAFKPAVCPHDCPSVCALDVEVLDNDRIGRVRGGHRSGFTAGVICAKVARYAERIHNPARLTRPLLRTGKKGRGDFTPIGWDEALDLFVCVHEQFMTETALMADIVLPATMFLEHDDLYLASGHQGLQFSGRLVEPPGQCRSNHEVISGLAQRLGAHHSGFAMTPRQLIHETLVRSGHGTLAALESAGGIRDCQPDFNASHYLDGFAHEDGKFHFRPDWENVRVANSGLMGPVESLPEWPDHWAATEESDEIHPFRLATPPARGYLNTSFNNLPTSRQQTGRPLALVHPDDAAALDLRDGDPVWLGNERGQVGLLVRLFAGIQRGVIVVEGLSPNTDFSQGEGINTLTGADQPAPYGGAPFHDVHVWMRKRLEKA